MLALRTMRTSLFMCACLCMCVPSIVKVGFVCNDFKELYQGTAQRYYVQDIGYFYAKFAHLFLNLSYFTAKEISLQPSREKLIQESINTQRLRIKAGPSEKRRYKKSLFSSKFIYFESNAWHCDISKSRSWYPHYETCRLR